MARDFATSVACQEQASAMCAQHVRPHQSFVKIRTFHGLYTDSDLSGKTMFLKNYLGPRYYQEGVP